MWSHSGVTHDNLNGSPGGAPAAQVLRRSERHTGACVAVLAAVHEHSGYPTNWPADPGGWLSPASLLSAWVAECDGRVLGHIGLAASTGDDVAPGLWKLRAGGHAADTCVITRLFVAPAARGRGVGALLVGRAAEEARSLGRHPVLDVVTTDTSAIALYERLGWEFLADREQRWGPGQTVTVRCYAAPGGFRTAAHAGGPGGR